MGGIFNYPAPSWNRGYSCSPQLEVRVSKSNCTHQRCRLCFPLRSLAFRSLDPCEVKKEVPPVDSISPLSQHSQVPQLLGS